MFESPMARPPPCIQDRARRVLLAFRGTGHLSPSTGLISDGWKAAPFESRTARPLPSSNGQRPGRLLMVAPPRSASPAATPRCRLAPPAATPRRRPMINN